MTELPNSFTTQTWLPPTVMPRGWLKPYFGPLMTLTRAPVEAENSVTELPSAFATQRSSPFDVMAAGLSNP